MSVGGSLSQQLQLQQDLQNELTTANLHLRQISMELQKIKKLTAPGGEFENNIKQNAALIASLANMQKIDLDKVPQMKRMQIVDTDQNMSYEQHDSFRNMDDSQ